MSAPVIGIYGNHSDRGIEKLGFITLDEQCQLALDTAEQPVEDDKDDGEEAVVDEQEEPKEEESSETNPDNEENAGEEEEVAGEDDGTATQPDDGTIVPTEGDKDDLTPVEDPEKETGLSTMSKVLIGAGSLVAVVLIAFAVVMMLKKRAKGENVAQETSAKKSKSDLESGAENPPASTQN